MAIDLPLSFVLMAPSHPGNIGAAARAIKTMGFRELRLVSPRFANALSHPEAIAYASSAADLLQSATVFATLEAALSDCTLVIGLSARTREFAPPLLNVDAACEAALDEIGAAPGHRVAFVFGTERIGLTIEQAQRCHRLAQIDAEPECSSLNLAQSVQVVSYELRRACSRCRSLSSTRELDAEHVVHAEHDETEQFFVHLRKACEAVGFIDPEHPKKLFERMRRLFARTRLEREEVHLLRGLCKQMILAGEAFQRKR
jgi:tRNA/rRNA methyltransferase